MLALRYLKKRQQQRGQISQDYSETLTPWKGKGKGKGRKGGRKEGMNESRRAQQEYSS